MASNPIINNLWAACNRMRQDPGTTGALQYIQQFSWLLFLKVYEETEKKRQTESKLAAKKFSPNISSDYTWSKWAYDKDLTGKDLIKFVNEDLFPYLRGLDGNKTQKTIARIFDNSNNLMQDGYLLKEAIEKIRDTNFFSDDESFAVSEIYEGLFSKMKASDLKPLAEFYTPRPIGKFMTEMVNPEIGETVYDPANGPSGFLVESFYWLKKKAKSSKDIETLHEHSLYGKEVKPLPFVLGMMNLILNGVESPNIIKTNTLGINVMQLAERDKHNIVLTNPPFSGQLKGVGTNFPYPSGATEILFLQHSMRSIKHRGRCGIIFPDSVLSTTDEQAYVNTKKELIENFNLHTIIKLPSGSFAPYTTIPTNILFFDKLGKTENIWYYEVQIPNGKKNFTKTNPIRYENFEECISLWSERPDTACCWTIPIEKVIEENYDLDFKNPTKGYYKSYPDSLKLSNKITENQKAFSIKVKHFNDEFAEFYSSASPEFKIVPLSQVLKQYQIKTYVEDKQKYKQLTISKYDGIKQRGWKFGKEIGRKRQFIVDLDKYPNTILYTRQTLQQDEAIGLAPYEVNGCVVTENMPMFTIEGAEPLYVHYYFKSAFFLKQLHKTSARGMSQKTIHEEKFLTYLIPLPKPAVQKAIIKMIQEINSLIKEKEESDKLFLDLLPSALQKMFTVNSLDKESADEIRNNNNTELKALFPSVLDKAFKGEL